MAALTPFTQLALSALANTVAGPIATAATTVLSATAAVAAPVLSTTAATAAAPVIMPVAAVAGGAATVIGLAYYAMNYGLKAYAISQVGNGVAILYFDKDTFFGVSTVGVITFTIGMVLSPYLFGFVKNIWARAQTRSV